MDEAKTNERSTASRRERANAARALSMDAVEAASSGHPGAPMGLADVAEVLWNDFLRHNPAHPEWLDRDRFVLSNGHASALLYALLHLTGYDLSRDDLASFRQLRSRTPGHPERGITPGVEVTTGPLGQGLANAVGLAVAERALAARFNRPGHTIIDHHTYVFAGDGCLMEGISHEACSLAGTLGLGKLVVFYDDNQISIDGRVEGWFTDDTPARFDAYGWHVIPAVDGHDPQRIRWAIEKARAVTDRPSLICCRTVIGYGAPRVQGTHHCHGAPLGKDEVAAARKALGWSHEPFSVPEPIRAAWDARARGAALERDWNRRFAAYQESHPDLAAELLRRIRGELPESWAQRADLFLRTTDVEKPAVATRKASQIALDAYAPLLPEMVGGSADLTGSNLTATKRSRPFGPATPDGDYVHYGVREFGMFAVMNGMAVHGGLLPYGGTFLTFSDYGRNALRMAALMRLRVVFVLTHDSIGVGEDGPTHQPVEHVASLRLIPGMSVWRPCDALETAVAWKAAIERRDGPTCLVLSRQNLPAQARSALELANVARGGYVLAEAPDRDPDAIVIATGSEIAVALDAQRALSRSGRRVRVVSMPSTDAFDAQPPAYREAVLPRRVTRRMVIEAGATGGWWRYVGMDGCVLGLDRFGESAPAGELFPHFGLTAGDVVSALGRLP